MRVTICSYFCLALAWAQYFDPQISNRQSSPALGDYRVQNNNNQISTSVAQNSAIPVFVNNNVPGTSTAIGTGSISFGTGGPVIDQDVPSNAVVQSSSIDNNVPGTNTAAGTGSISFGIGGPVVNQNAPFTSFAQTSENSAFADNSGSISVGNLLPVVNQDTPFSPFVPNPGAPVFINSNIPGTNNVIGAGSTSFGNGSPLVNPTNPSVVPTASPTVFTPVSTSSSFTAPILQPIAPPLPPVTSQTLQPAAPPSPLVASPILQPAAPPSPPVASPILQPAAPPSPPVASPLIPQPASPPSPVTSPPISPGPVNNDSAPPLCHIRQCDQTITGRGLSYSRALEILQNEDYLTEADLNVIRIKRSDILKRYKRQGPAPPFSPPTPPGPSTLSVNTNAVSIDPTNLALPVVPVMISFTIAAIISFAILIGTAPAPVPITFVPADPIGPIGLTGPPIRFVGTPVSDPLPGQLGGGQLPIGNSSEVLEALSLVPDGLQAVSVFPPYIRLRTYDAVGVIFREQSNNFQRRFGTSPRLFIAQKIKQAWNRYFGSNRRDGGGQHYHGHGPTFGSDGQIFEEDLFGFRIRVTLVNETCTLGLTCDANGNKISSFGFTSRIDDFYDRQTGQEFTSDAPPDCRTILNPNGCT